MKTTKLQRVTGWLATHGWIIMLIYVFFVALYFTIIATPQNHVQACDIAGCVGNSTTTIESLSQNWAAECFPSNMIGQAICVVGNFSTKICTFNKPCEIYHNNIAGNNIAGEIYITNK